MMTIWEELEILAKEKRSLNDLFKTKGRCQKFSLSYEELFYDFSKQLIDESVFESLLSLAEERNLRGRIKELYRGDKVNNSEDRAALHTALRIPSDKSLMVDGIDIAAAVHGSLDKVAQISERIRQKIWRGASGKPITDVVNIGVGGSDLGPLMTLKALEEFTDPESPQVHFISNMDGTQLQQLLGGLSQENTLFIISSKSFGTADTLSNAATAISWLKVRFESDRLVFKNHIIGVSAANEKMLAFGIPEQNQLELWDWVGGRFSMWSAIGLAIAIKLGMKQFRELLSGAHSMDEHFYHADFEKNLPVVMGLMGVWNSTFLDINAHTVLPYDGRLKFFPDYLMQLEMESNGKSVNRVGKKVSFNTAPVMWGDVGSNAQHAFYQLLHQGTQRVSCDFIAPIKRYDQAAQVKVELESQHQMALANCLAQSRVLAFGNHALEFAQDAAHKNYRGNQPSSTLLMQRLSPYSLGMLIAAYEHKTFVMSVIWDINPFDQWGVEGGKVMAGEVLSAIKGDTKQFDCSTNTLLNLIKNA